MADEQNELRQINWNEVFAFTHIFKGFRMAIHPSKLLLAFGAIVMVFLTGWFLGWLWSVGGQNVAQDEIVAHAVKSPPDFRAWLTKYEKSRPEKAVEIWQTENLQQHSLDAYARSMGSSGDLHKAFRALRDKRNEGKDFQEPDAAKLKNLRETAEEDVDDVLDPA